MKWAGEAGISEDKFTASNGWITGVLKRNGKISINLHGEADNMIDEAAAALMNPWLKGFHKQIEDLAVPQDIIHNADQTGSFYTKLPNRIYVDKVERKNYAGNKQMKEKYRITLMVCTSAAGEKLPLAIIGKSKRP